ncbi:hypothetical protein JNM87_01190 [Candidatus Saccharibacteria bacterium]|nr:hypothetical protein [Candidatus Saccharibacteria bacterium]
MASVKPGESKKLRITPVRVLIFFAIFIVLTLVFHLQIVNLFQHGALSSACNDTPIMLPDGATGIVDGPCSDARGIGLYLALLGAEVASIVIALGWMVWRKTYRS